MGRCREGEVSDNLSCSVICSTLIAQLNWADNSWIRFVTGRYEVDGPDHSTGDQPDQNQSRRYARPT